MTSTNDNEQGTEVRAQLAELMREYKVARDKVDETHGAYNAALEERNLVLSRIQTLAIAEKIPISGLGYIDIREFQPEIDRLVATLEWLGLDIANII